MVAPAIFQQVMDAVIADCKFAIPYLDDILNKCESNDQHVKHIKCVFEKMIELWFHTE